MKLSAKDLHLAVANDYSREQLITFLRTNEDWLTKQGLFLQALSVGVRLCSIQEDDSKVAQEILFILSDSDTDLDFSV